MVTSVVTMRGDERVRDAVRLLLKNHFSGVPVVDDDGRLVGVISEKDCIRALMLAMQDHVPAVYVRDVMTKEGILTITEDTHVLTIAHLFLTHPVRRLPVVRGEKLVGQVSRRDLLAAAFEVFEKAPSREAAILYLSAVHGRPPSM